MKPPIPLASSHLYAHRLRSEALHLRGVLSSWFLAAMLSIGLAGVSILAAGIILGAALHKSAYIIGGILAVLCLILFAAFQEAWGAISLLLGLLEFDDAIPREGVLKHLNACVNKRKPAVIPSNADFDETIMQTMKGLPSKLVGILAKSLQAGPALVSLISAVCAACIFLSGFPNLLAALPIVLASLAISGTVCGFAVQVHAAVIMRNIAAREIEIFESNQDPFKATLLELHMNMLRRKLGATSEGALSNANYCVFHFHAVVSALRPMCLTVCQKHVVYILHIRFSRPTCSWVS